MRVKFPKVIKADWLRKVGACRSGAAEFRALFPKGARLDRESIAKAVRELGAGRVWWLIDRAVQRAATERLKYSNEYSAIAHQRLYGGISEKSFHERMTRLFVRYARKAGVLQEVKRK